MPLFTATLQYPLSPDLQKHPPILLFNLQEIRICIDPLLCRWLLYKPKQINPFNETSGYLLFHFIISSELLVLFIQIQRYTKQRTFLRRAEALSKLQDGLAVK